MHGQKGRGKQLRNRRIDTVTSRNASSDEWTSCSHVLNRRRVLSRVFSRDSKLHAELKSILRYYWNPCYGPGGSCETDDSDLAFRSPPVRRFLGVTVAH